MRIQLWAALLVIGTAVCVQYGNASDEDSGKKFCDKFEYRKLTNFGNANKSEYIMACEAGTQLSDSGIVIEDAPFHCSNISKSLDVDFERQEDNRTQGDLEKVCVVAFMLHQQKILEEITNDDPPTCGKKVCQDFNYKKLTAFGKYFNAQGSTISRFEYDLACQAGTQLSDRGMNLEEIPDHCDDLARSLDIEFENSTNKQFQGDYKKVCFIAFMDHQKTCF